MYDYKHSDSHIRSYFLFFFLLRKRVNSKDQRCWFSAVCCFESGALVDARMRCFLVLRAELSASSDGRDLNYGDGSNFDLRSKSDPSPGEVSPYKLAYVTAIPFRPVLKRLCFSRVYAAAHFSSSTPTHIRLSLTSVFITTYVPLP